MTIMERKLRNATAKLRNLKDFLSSTRNLNQSSSSSGASSSSPEGYHEPNRKNSKGSNGTSGPFSVSLFDLADTTNNTHQPSSNFQNGGTFHHPKSSISMYGLASPSIRDADNVDISHHHTRPTSNSGKNPAMRLFYTIRSKFRKRRRDRACIIVDSKSADFGSYKSGGTKTHHYGTTTQSEDSRNDPSWIQHLNLESSQSVDQLQYIGNGDFDQDNFNPLGIRDRNYGKENNSPRLTSAISCFVINDNTCQSPVIPLVHDANQMDQSPLLPTIAPKPPPKTNRPTISFTRSTSSPPAPPQILSSSPIPPSPSEPNKLKGLAKELFDLIHYGWYWGSLSKEEAEEKLKCEPDGAFIVRDSSSSVHILSLSFNSNGKTKHTRIDYVDGKFCFLASETEAFPSVAELIEHWIKHSEQGIFCYSKSNRANGPTSYPVRLTKPVSRFTEVKSLQFLSSFVLYQYTRLDLIPKLPLPPQLIDFIGQQHYF